MLEIKEAEVLKKYKEARENVKANYNTENWIKFCNAKRECMLLGVRI